MMPLTAEGGTLARKWIASAEDASGLPLERRSERSRREFQCLKSTLTSAGCGFTARFEEAAAPRHLRRVPYVAAIRKAMVQAPGAGKAAWYHVATAGWICHWRTLRVIPRGEISLLSWERERDRVAGGPGSRVREQSSGSSQETLPYHHLWSGGLGELGQLVLWKGLRPF